MTAVEWLRKELLKRDMDISIKELFEQAKKIEKEQIIDAQSYAISNADMSNNRGYFDCDKYYNETYGSKGSADQVLDVRKMVDNWDNVFDKIESEYDCHIPLKVVNYLNKYYKVPTSSQTEISDDVIIPKNATNVEVFAIKPDEDGKLFAYIGYKMPNGNFHFTIVPFTEPIKEISDEEITNLANEHILYNDQKRAWVIEGMKLYREQLKSK